MAFDVLNTRLGRVSLTSFVHLFFVCFAAFLSLPSLSCVFRSLSSLLFQVYGMFRSLRSLLFRVPGVFRSLLFRCVFRSLRSLLFQVSGVFCSLLFRCVRCVVCFARFFGCVVCFARSARNASEPPGVTALHTMRRQARACTTMHAMRRQDTASTAPRTDAPEQRQQPRTDAPKSVDSPRTDASGCGRQASCPSRECQRCDSD